VSGRAAGGGWLALNLPLIGSIAACAREDARTGEPFRFLSADEGRTLEALAERLIPSIDGVGAREAGAAHFIDRILEGPFSDSAGFFRESLASLVDDGFAELGPEARDRYLEGIEDAPFFGFVRFLVIAGTFSDPRHGGGREDALHRIYGIEHAPGWDPPFGYYDAEASE
jgi:gluconate 2-dehydrogenase gamma chain